MNPLIAVIWGPMDLMIIGLVVLLLFGNRLPSVMRSLGRGVVEFKKGVSGIDDDADHNDHIESPPTPKKEQVEKP